MVRIGESAAPQLIGDDNSLPAPAEARSLLPMLAPLSVPDLQPSGIAQSKPPTVTIPKPQAKPAAKAPPLVVARFDGSTIFNEVKLTSKRYEGGSLVLYFATVSRLAEGIKKATAVDGKEYTGGTMKVGLPSPKPEAVDEKPMRQHAFDATLIKCYGIELPLDDAKRAQIAALLSDPSIASQRKAYVESTAAAGTKLTIVFPKQPKATADTSEKTVL